MSKQYALRLFLCCFCLVLGAQVSQGLASGHEHPAQAYVWQENLPDKVVYHYRIINQAQEVSITKVIVGYDYYHGVPVLTSRPTQIRSPSGWSGQIVSTEETRSVEVEWRRDDRSYSIQPGQELRGFALEVPTADNNYRTFYTLYFGDGTPASRNLLADTTPPPGDNAPPVLSVVATPAKVWPPNNKMVNIEAAITVQDDQDPAPVIRLVSVTCNECEDVAVDVVDAETGSDDRSFSVRAKRTGQRKEGRVYTITYSATDAAGNSATAEATVTVPHDMRK